MTERQNAPVVDLCDTGRWLELSRTHHR